MIVNLKQLLFDVCQTVGAAAAVEKSKVIIWVKKRSATQLRLLGHHNSMSPHQTVDRH